MEDSELKKSIAIIGIMGSGKSSLGKKLARKMEVDFFDLDEEIKNKTDYSPKEIYNYFGNNMLHAIEFEVLKEILEKPFCVISTGDSTIDNEKAWEYLKEKTTTLWLDISLKLISARLRPNEDRPYLNEEKIKSSTGLFKFVQNLHARRVKKYKESDLVVSMAILMRKNFLNKIINLVLKIQDQKKV